MSDFDEYFEDDFVLDESTLAVLDAEERKFNQFQHPRPTQPVPPPKRQKTEQGWKHTRGLTQTDSYFEDLPEISVGNDGSYGMLEDQPEAPNTFKNRSLLQSAATQTRSNSRKSIAGSSANSSHTPHTGLPSQGQQQQLRSKLSEPRNGLVLPQTNRNFVRVSSQNATGNERMKSVPPPAQPVPPTTTNSRPFVQPTNDEISAIRTQLEQLNKSYEGTQQALKAAQDAQFAKEGEVSILRKNMEKTAQEHSATIAKLRAAKEAAEAMQAQVQKEMRDEIERMKTQFTFKQHELETTVRKPPWSVRGKKISKELPPTPMNMQRWNQPDFAGLSADNVKRTPSKPRVFPAFTIDSPDARRPFGLPHNQKAPEKSLPGFVNSFRSSSPFKSPEASHSEITKGRRKASQKSQNQTSVTQQRNKPSPQSSPTASQYVNMDVQMDDQLGDNKNDTFDQDNESEEEFDDFQPINWATELHRTICSHTIAASTTSTIQTLMSVAVPPTSESDPDLFSQSCSELWTTISSLTVLDQLSLAYLCRRLSAPLVTIASILSNLNLIPALTAIIGLLKTLIFCITPFCGYVLSVDEDDELQRSRIVTVLCNVIRNHLVPSTEHKISARMTLKQRQSELNPVQTSLAEESLGLLEALCWSAPDTLETRLAIIARGDRILDILLDNRQPSWFLSRAVRGLVLFASRSSLFRHLLSFPESVDVEENDYSKIPHIERLCGYLADNSRQSAEAEKARNEILTLISTLSVAHADARTILLESESLIHSLVVRLTHLTSRLWEDDEQLMCCPELTNETSQSLCQTLFLLHDLVFNTQPQLDLKEKIRNANPASGIDHMFNVTFGRLTYAPDLVWVPDETSRRLTQITETAREILQVVVDSAEEDDMIYEAYQEEEPDDEEMEAMQLEANDL